MLPRTHALSSQWQQTFNHNTCENRLEEVQGAATSSLFPPPLPFKTRGHVYNSCVWSTMFHASETWPLTKPNLQCLQLNDRPMIRQICNVKPQNIVTTRSIELLAWLGIEDLDLILKERRLHWYGHVECSNGAIMTMEHIIASGLTKHFNQNDILYDLQHGFRERRSGKTQLLQLIDDLARNMTEGKQTDLILLDFSKAFDKVNHLKLLYKLQVHGVQGRTLG